MFKYSDLMKEIGFFKNYGVKVGSIGKSVLGADIPYIYLGSEESRKNLNIIVTGAIHAREHITALLVLCQARHIIKNKTPLRGGIYFIPMVNPDGVRLCQEGTGFLESIDIQTDIRKGLRDELVAINKSAYFGLWKANINCVDLNVNFDAGWGQGRNNVFDKSSSDYVGKSPLDQPESRSLAEFTLGIRPCATISYHCKGEEIYWNYKQTGRLLWNSYRLAKMLARETNYRLTDNKGSAGGYKDYCIQQLEIPAFTIEVGSDKLSHPFPYSQFESILKINKDVPHRLLCALSKEKKKPGAQLSFY